MSRSSDRTHMSEWGKGSMDAMETCSVYVNTGGPVCSLWQPLWLTDNFSSFFSPPLFAPTSFEWVRQMWGNSVLSYRAEKVNVQMLQWPFFFVAVSQSNSSLKKHRSRSIFSPFFCCFRNYNVDPPLQNNKTCSLPPPAAENSGSPKVNTCVCVFCLMHASDLFKKKPSI